MTSHARRGSRRVVKEAPAEDNITHQQMSTEQQAERITPGNNQTMTSGLEGTIRQNPGHQRPQVYPRPDNTAQRDGSHNDDMTEKGMGGHGTEKDMSGSAIPGTGRLLLAGSLSNPAVPTYLNVPGAITSAPATASSVPNVTQGPSSAVDGRLKWRGAPRNDDLTAYHPDQADWSLEKLPDILYVLRPTGQHYKSRAKIPKTTYPIFGKIVNDFPMLPIQISSRVEGWRVEAWCRMDRRITPEDIIDRVNPKFKITPADIQMRRYRFRQTFKIGAWGSGSSIGAVARLLERAGIDSELNSTRGLTPGLINPVKGEAGGRIPIPPNWLNFDSASWRPPRQGITSAPVAATVPNVVVPSSSEGTGPGLQTLTKRDESESKELDESKEKPPIEADDDEETQENLPPCPPYPNPEDCELAYHGGPPVRIFKEEEDLITMTLDEYLQKNNLTFEEHLEREEEPAPKAGPALPVTRDEDMDTFMALGRRLHRSIETPMKSSDSDFDDSASDILARFRGRH